MKKKIRILIKETYYHKLIVVMYKENKLTEN